MSAADRAFEAWFERAKLFARAELPPDAFVAETRTSLQGLAEIGAADPEGAVHALFQQCMIFRTKPKFKVLVPAVLPLLAAIAVPLLQADGTVIGALSLVTTVQRMAVIDQTKLTPLIQRAAREISSRLH